MNKLLILSLTLPLILAIAADVALLIVNDVGLLRPTVCALLFYLLRKPP